MNITKKEWYCCQCSLQFDRQHIYNLHLKLLHKHLIQTKSVVNELQSNEPHVNEVKLDLSNKIVSDQNEKKTFICEICQ